MIVVAASLVGMASAPGSAGESARSPQRSGIVVPYGAPIKPPVKPTGRILARVLRTEDGALRTYRLYVPSGLSTKRAVPLLVALHGGLGSAAQFARSSGFDGLAEANRFIVAYPDGTPIVPGARGGVWNGGGCCGVAQDARRDVDDVAFIALLIEKLEAELAIDPKRVFVTGHSNGAILAFRLACQLSEKVAAIGVQSGTLFTEPCSPQRRVAVLAIHGSADQNLPIAGGRGKKGVSGADFPPPLEGLRTLVAANACSRPPTRSTDRTNRAIAYTVWRPCASRVAVEWVEVTGAGHAWMGSSPSSPGGGLVGKPYARFDSSAAIWSFVAAHPRR